MTGKPTPGPIRKSVYPRPWVFEVLGESSPHLNDALTMWAGALLVAMEENEERFTAEQWDWLRVHLWDFHLDPNQTVPVQSIVAALPTPAPAVGKRAVATLMAMNYVNVVALLRVLSVAGQVASKGGALPPGWQQKQWFLKVVRKS